MLFVSPFDVMPHAAATKNHTRAQRYLIITVQRPCSSPRHCMLARYVVTIIMFSQRRVRRHVVVTPLCRRRSNHVTVTIRPYHSDRLSS